jgi:hypothetical protein
MLDVGVGYGTVDLDVKMLKAIPVDRELMAEGRVILTVVRPLALAALFWLALPGALQGCSTTPAEQEAIGQAWAARDAERAAECRRNGLGFAAGGCLSRSP